jgi:hypothetical protein
VSELVLFERIAEMVSTLAAEERCDINIYKEGLEIIIQRLQTDLDAVNENLERIEREKSLQ